MNRESWLQTNNVGSQTAWTAEPWQKKKSYLLYFSCLDLYFGCLDLYFGYMDLYLGIWTCILVPGLVFGCLDLYLGAWACILGVCILVGCDYGVRPPPHPPPVSSTPLPAHQTRKKIPSPPLP